MQPKLIGTPRTVAPIRIVRVADKEKHELWRELVGRYHYLGYKVPFGAQLRYLIELAQPKPTIAGCLQLSSPAWRIAVRDRWIGWTDRVRLQNLQRVVSNSRFLLLPWVEVRNLASIVLSQISRRCSAEWEATFGIRPLLLETLVDSGYLGTSYRAANWIDLGQTQGRGRMDRYHRCHGARPKRVFVYPLARNAREKLRFGSSDEG